MDIASNDACKRENNSPSSTRNIDCYSKELFTSDNITNIHFCDKENRFKYKNMLMREIYNASISLCDKFRFNYKNIYFIEKQINILLNTLVDENEPYIIRLNIFMTSFYYLQKYISIVYKQIVSNIKVNGILYYILICINIACKTILDETKYTNGEICSILHIDYKIMTKNELTMLNALGWNISIITLNNFFSMRNKNC